MIIVGGCSFFAFEGKDSVSFAHLSSPGAPEILAVSRTLGTCT
jgi:hypothetical protein